MEMEGQRKRIDEIDRRILSLFEERMAVCEEIGRIKKTLGLPVTDEKREAKKLEELRGLAGSDMAQYVEMLYNILMEAGKSRQYEIMKEQ